MMSTAARRIVVERGGATIGVSVGGDGPLVAMVPSLGRAGSDFDHLASAVAAAGFTVAAIDPRGLDGEGLDKPLTLHDLAADVAAAITAVSGVGVHLVGHALGNRICRCVTADHPGLVRSLTLLAAGGLVEPEPDAWAALAGCFVVDRDAAEHLADVGFAFFAPGNDPAVWQGGWFPEVAAAQRAAVVATDRDEWWHATAPDVLVIQGLQDRIAVPANGRRYVESVGATARLTEIDGAGHALLPERPTEVAAALIDFLSRVSE